MKFKEPITVQTLADIYGCRILGDSTKVATGINEIHRVEKGDIVFVDAEKYYSVCLNSAASIIIVNKEVDVPEGKTLLVTDHPFSVYNAIVLSHRPFAAITKNSTANIDASSIIEPNVSIGNNVSIGKNCYIQSHVYLADHTVIGNNVQILANTSIGTDAFYFKKENGVYNKWHSGGHVIIEDDVHIASGCTINKGVSSATIIGQGTKIDCQVHIGHGVHIGKNCLIVAQSGVAGKCNIEDNVTIYGQVAIAPNLTIGTGAVVLAQSGVAKNLDANKVYFGYPASESKQKFKELAVLRRLAREA